MEEDTAQIVVMRLKAAVFQLKNIKNEKILKLTISTGQVMFSGEIYYY